MKWQADLLLVQDTVEVWAECQKNWMRLETIFSAADIQKQLPESSAIFKQVDSGFKDIMKSTEENPRAKECCVVPKRKEEFISYNYKLDKIQKNLEEYLETKRNAFGRFYFLSDDELLQILAQVRDPQAVQPHLRKCFDMIGCLIFAEGKIIDITDMVSPKGEVVSFGKIVKARGPVEEWLMTVQINMQLTVKRVLKAATLDYENHTRSDWIINQGHTGQSIATAAQIVWTRKTEEAFNNETNPSQVNNFCTDFFMKYNIRR